MLGITTPPFQNKGEEDEEYATNNEVRNSETPAMLGTDQIGSNVAFCIKLVHKLLRNEPVCIFRSDNSIADEQTNRAIDGESEQPTPPFAESRVIDYVVEYNH